MKHHIKYDEWRIIEDRFNPSLNEVSESLFSLGNGRFGQRANFEEKFSGATLQGNYVAGIYYPDKTRVGWWKNGYPDYFAKVLNACNWIGINVSFGNQEIDMATNTIHSFRRELNMKDGYLKRSAEVELQQGRVQIESTRFCSLADDEIGAIKYSLKPDFSGTVSITPYLDADVINKDANYDEKFWNQLDQFVTNGSGWILAETKKTKFQVCTGMDIAIEKNGEVIAFDALVSSREGYVENEISLEITKGEELVLYKYVSIVSSQNYEKSELIDACTSGIKRAKHQSFDKLLEEQSRIWAQKWANGDIIIEGDVSAQQGIRFNIFQLHQTYTGEDAGLNIGPKGFTGEKYGGTTYWDTEAYCLDFYLATAPQKVARNLLIYRYKHLDRAIENAKKLGFNNGAALYPMVTMNGEECHNEWEITFEEIHRNGAIAYAIFNYIDYTGDQKYLIEYGLEVLIAISRFWSQRVNWSAKKKKYVMLGVTGPNEYENNVDNNWYTLKMADWTLRYTQEAIEHVKTNHAQAYQTLIQKIKFSELEERNNWNHILENLYFPEDKDRQIFLQQDGFLDKEIISVNKIHPNDRPLNQNWSWDRILRSCYIKQADTLQGLYLFYNEYGHEVVKRNFDFYEPITVHESSLSPCIHSILAARLGYQDKAYEMYARSARLDLDNYNNDTEDGCHITSMAGSWMSIVKGFGGMRVKNGQLYLAPILPKEWTSFSFKIGFRRVTLEICVKKDNIRISNLSDSPININIREKKVKIEPNAANHLIEHFEKSESQSSLQLDNYPLDHQ